MNHLLPSVTLLLLLLMLWLEARLVASNATLGFPRFFLLFLYGATGAFVLGFAVERIAGIRMDTETVAYSVGPFAEEAAKAIPVFVLAFLVYDGRRLTIADLALIGFATGLGFEFVEDNLRTLAQGGLPRDVTDVSIFDPGWREAAGGVATAAGHAFWTGCVGLAAGVGLRLWPRDNRRWIPAAVVLGLVIVDHAMFNWELSQEAARERVGFVGPFPLLWIPYGLTLAGHLELLALPVGAVLASAWEGRGNWEAMGAPDELLLPGEHLRPNVAVEWLVALIHLSHGPSAFLRAVDYFRLRRRTAAAAADAAERPDDEAAQHHLERMLERAAEAREEVDPAYLPERGSLPAPAPLLGAVGDWLQLYGLGVALGLLAILLFFIPPASAPTWLTRVTGSPLAAIGLGLLALGYSAYRVFLLRGTPAPDPVTGDAETAVGYHARAILLGGSLVCASMSLLGWLLPKAVFDPGIAFAFATGHIGEFARNKGNAALLLALLALMGLLPWLTPPPSTGTDAPLPVTPPQNFDDGLPLPRIEHDPGLPLPQIQHGGGVGA